MNDASNTPTGEALLRLYAGGESLLQSIPSQVPCPLADTDGSHPGICDFSKLRALLPEGLRHEYGCATGGCVLRRITLHDQEGAMMNLIPEGPMINLIQFVTRRKRGSFPVGKVVGAMATRLLLPQLPLPSE